MNHALYRGVAGEAYNSTSGPFGVMESQPGLLNWAQHRVSPLEGMVRFWTHEVFAGSGDHVVYFRWRQAPYAQEQTLSGLFTSDNSPDAGYAEAKIVGTQDLEKLRVAEDEEPMGQADVALIFDYTSQWVWEIEPHSGWWDFKNSGWSGATVSYKDIVYSFYNALRRLGLSVDIISPEQPISGYKMVVVPSLPIIPDNFNSALSKYSGQVIFGPNTGSRTQDFAYPPGLNPSDGTLRQRLPMRVTRVETTPPEAGSKVSYDGKDFSISGWEEWVFCERDNRTSTVSVKYSSSFRNDTPAACSKGGTHYIGFNPSSDFLVSYLGDIAAHASLKSLTGKLASKDTDLGPTLRLTRRGNLLWVFNFALKSVEAPEIEGAELLIGDGGMIKSADFVVYKLTE
jgi:beta-galactosidase GanA